MTRLHLAGHRRQLPLVVLSLLLNIGLLGTSIAWWSGVLTLNGGSRIALQATATRHALGATPTAFDACERAQLDEQKLQDWGCKVFSKACFDQDGMILHSGEKTPDHPLFIEEELFEPVVGQAYVLPGYEEPLGTSHFAPKCWKLDTRGPTPFDPPDVWQPKEFTNCTVPLVWWPTYFSIFADLYLSSAAALDSMMAERAMDRNVLLAPVSLGMDLPPMYQLLLEPYTRHKVVSLSSLSSREHVATGRPRCFERCVVCNIVGMYTGTETRDLLSLRPKAAGRHAVSYYRQMRPEVFAPHEQRAAAEGGAVFRVGFMPRTGRVRHIRNLAAVVEECNAWAPPEGTQYQRVECVQLPDGSPETHVELLARVQHVHALVSMHGSSNVFAYFMPNGTGLVEVVAWTFHGEGCTWADQYYADYFEVDHTVDSGYFRLVADKDHTFPGPYEKKQIGSDVAYGRDSDVDLDFPTLAKALAKIARGELRSEWDNREERTFFMTRQDICPGHKEWLEAQEKAEEFRTDPSDV